MKKKIDLENHKKDASPSYMEIDEEQNFISELGKQMEREIVSEGLFILAIYVLFMDVDL